MVFAATGLPAVSVIAPVCIVSLYLVLAFSFVWVMVSVFPLMDLPVFTGVPLLVFSSILGLLLVLMFSLKVILMFLFRATLVAVLAGLTLVILGRVVSILNLLVYAVFSVLPAVSVMLFVGSVMV